MDFINGGKCYPRWISGFKTRKEYDNLYYSALARQQADWLVGINGTRLFTVLYRNKVLKVGRVQTPTLAMLVDREGEIMRFRKEPFYTVNIELNGIKAVSEKYKDRSQADILMSKAKDGEAAVKAITREQKSVNPPKLYDLTSLQRDANKLFGFTAKRRWNIHKACMRKSLSHIRERIASFYRMIWKQQLKV